MIFLNRWIYFYWKIYRETERSPICQTCKRLSVIIILPSVSVNLIRNLPLCLSLRACIFPLARCYRIHPGCRRWRDCIPLSLSAVPLRPYAPRLLVYQWAPRLILRLAHCASCAHTSSPSWFQVAGQMLASPPLGSFPDRLCCFALPSVAQGFNPSISLPLWYFW